MDNKISQQVFDELFRKYSKVSRVYLRGSKEKDENYDSFRDTGYVETSQNSLPVKVLTRTINPSTLVFREMGLTEAGAIQVVLNTRDVELYKLSIKITIDNKEYYVYSDAVENKAQIFPTQFAKYSRMILFKKDLGNA